MSIYKLNALIWAASASPIDLIATSSKHYSDPFIVRSSCDFAVFSPGFSYDPGDFQNINTITIFCTFFYLNSPTRLVRLTEMFTRIQINIFRLLFERNFHCILVQVFHLNPIKNAAYKTT